ncbi:MAG: 3'-5' exonuclease domain-containing protein 2 [Dysgonamonadaceae bacterium]|jgi:ribonuclease D|nr:3'-5' exonuclease domain-containing protein 2 [Dysgonamonadaceae bacterium]
MESSITKETILTLEPETFTGRIIVVQSLAEAEKAVDYLSCCSMIGFDTETRPSYKKGVFYLISLIQLSTEDTCFLFRLNIIGFPQCLIDLLSNPNVKKIGLSLKDDFASMNRRQAFTPEGFVDLQKIVQEYGITVISLQKVYATLFNKKISKNQRLTNWEADVLTESQKRYAALDAWACLKIYNKLKTKSEK